MNPSYFRIRLPFSEAKQRLTNWLEVGELHGIVATECVNAVRLACTPEGRWRGAALFMYESEGWTVFEDLTGGFGALPRSRWLSFARKNDFVYAAYNDAICSAEVVMISDGVVVREFSRDRDNPETNVDLGRLPSESGSPFQSWIDVASLVDEDRIYGSDRGWLWVREST